MPLNPIKYSVFNMNYEQKPHTKLKMYFSRGIPLECSLFKSQRAGQKAGQGWLDGAAAGREGAQPPESLPGRDQVIPTFLTSQRLVHPIIFVKILLMYVISHKVWPTIGFEFCSLFFKRLSLFCFLTE